MIKIIFLILLFEINLPIYKSECWNFEINIDYIGGDISQQPILFDDIDSCCNFCNSLAFCKAWTYLPESKSCWVKNTTEIFRLSSIGRKLT